MPAPPAELVARSRRNVGSALLCASSSTYAAARPRRPLRAGALVLEQMPGTHRWKLFLMMVLQFFIWGAWLPLIFGYLDKGLGFTKGEQAAILDAFPIAAIVGMVFSNQFADRNFAAQKFLAVSHLIGGLAILGLGFTREFWPFVILMYLHCLVYVPTISITNAIAFTHLNDSEG